MCDDDENECVCLCVKNGRNIKIHPQTAHITSHNIAYNEWRGVRKLVNVGVCGDGGG